MAVRERNPGAVRRQPPFATEEKDVRNNSKTMRRSNEAVELLRPAAAGGKASGGGSLAPR